MYDEWRMRKVDKLDAFQDRLSTFSSLIHSFASLMSNSVISLSCV